MSKELEGRIIDLESISAYQEKMIEDLNGVIFSQQKEIDQIFEKLKLLEGQVKNFDLDSEKRTLSDEKPPHY
jgi:SlyX protein